MGSSDVVSLNMFKNLVLLAALFILSSCSKQENGQFQLEYRMSLEIPADANPLFTHVFEKAIASDWNNFLAAHNLNQSNLVKIRPRSVILSPVFNNSISYGIISEIHASIYDLNDPGGMLPIADIYDNIRSDEELVLLPGLADVKELIKNEEFILKLELNLRQFPGSVSDHFLTVQFDVFVN